MVHEADSEKRRLISRGGTLEGRGTATSSLAGLRTLGPWYDLFSFAKLLKI